MIIRSATYIKSSSKLSQCPNPDKPEYAFIGRSNVGKSSLINMLTGFSKLAKTSGQPGKTQTINHFLINEQWYLADLPGYGYAKVSKKLREGWQELIHDYITKRGNLVSVFIIIDSRHEPIDSDLKFMKFLGLNQIPFARVFTKADKQKASGLEKVLKLHEQKMLEEWESLPVHFITSAQKRSGRKEILNYIEETKTFFEKS